MAIPPVSGSPPSKKAEETKKMGGEEPKNPSVKELASKLVIPMGKPAPIKKAVQEAPSEEPGRPIEDTGIHLPPPPRQGRARMALPGEKLLPDNPPPRLDALKANTAPAELGQPARPAVRGIPKKAAPPVTAPPKMYTPMKVVVGDLEKNPLFKKQQELHNPRQADKYLHDVASEHGHLFHEATGVFINTKTAEIVAAEDFKVIVADTTGNYDLAVKGHEAWDAPTPDRHEEFSVKQEATERLDISTPHAAERYLRTIAIHYGYEFNSDLGGVFLNFKDNVLIDAKQFAAVMFGEEVLKTGIILGNCGLNTLTQYAGPVHFEKLSTIGQPLEDYRIATNRYISGLKGLGLLEITSRTPSVIERAARKGYVASLQGLFIKTSGKDMGDIKRNKDFL